MATASSPADVAQHSELTVEEEEEMVFSKKKSPIGDIEEGMKSNRQSTESAISTGGVDEKKKKPQVPALFQNKKATSSGASPGDDFDAVIRPEEMMSTCAFIDLDWHLAIEKRRQHMKRLEEEKKKRSRYGQESTTSMSPKMYRAVTSGDTAYFSNWDQSDSVSPRGNTILHIAASFGHDELVKLILQKSPEQLVEKKNRTSDTPLHVAASAGHLSTVQIFFPDKSGEEQLLSRVENEEQLSRVKNNEENTPLHVALKQLLTKKENVALKNRYEKVARVLFDADPEASYSLNEEGKSPLYLAAEAGFVELVKLMMEQLPINDRSEMKGKSIVHAAITSKNIDVLRTMLVKSDDHAKDFMLYRLLMKVDDEGFTPLSYAAFIDHLGGVRYILQRYPNFAYINNGNGTFPIHVASSKGHIKIIKEFLECCPDLGEMLTKDNYWNILHVAAKNGKDRAVRHMLKLPALEMLINERDTNGNTPLHLASEGGHPKVVSILTWDKRVELNLLNYEGNTALDIAANYSENLPSFRKRLTWQALRYADALRADQLPNIFEMKLQSSDQPEEILSKTQSLDQSGNPGSKPQSSDQPEEKLSKTQSLDQSGKPGSKPQSSDQPEEILSKTQSSDNYTDRVDTLLLVATLITTVTFATGFTIPGGYSSSEPHQGMAIFLERPMFQSFLITNTIAMYSSITVVVALIWAHLGDLYLVRASIRIAVPLLGLALVMVSVTFMTGIYLAVSSLNWLAYTVLIMGSIFIFILVVLFVPLYSPSSLHHYIPRYIFYYQLCLLIRVLKWSDIDNEEGES